MSERGKVKVAIVGAGLITSRIHIPVLRQISNSMIVGVYDINSETSKSVAERNKIPKVYESLEDLVEDDTIDLVNICTPIHTHISIIETALKAGKNVITEKPLASNSDEANRIVKLSERKNLVLGVSQNHLYSKAIQGLNTRIREGNLGELQLLNITYPITMYKKDHWTANPDTGGVLFELGIHPAYIATFLFGSENSTIAFGHYPTKEQPMGSIVINLKRDNAVCNILLPPVEDQPTIRAYGTKAYEFVNLFADSNIFNDKKISKEYGPMPMMPMTTAGFYSIRDWIDSSFKVTLAYFKRGLKYFIYRHRIINQYTFFNEIISLILDDNEDLRKNNQKYLEVAVESIRLLEKVRKCLTDM
jgi:predicted dehydrogenase